MSFLHRMLKKELSFISDWKMLLSPATSHIQYDHADVFIYS